MCLFCAELIKDKLTAKEASSILAELPLNEHSEEIIELLKKQPQEFIEEMIDSMIELKAKQDA